MLTVYARLLQHCIRTKDSCVLDVFSSWNAIHTALVASLCALLLVASMFIVSLQYYPGEDNVYGIAEGRRELKKERKKGKRDRRLRKKKGKKDERKEEWSDKIRRKYSVLP